MRAFLSLAMLIMLVGCMTTVAKVQFRPASDTPATGLTEMTVAGTGQRVYLAPDVIFANEDFECARLIQKADGLQVEFVVSKTGRERFATMRTSEQMKSLAILLDGRLIGAPVTIGVSIIGAVNEFKITLGGHFSDQDARRIVDSINKK